MNHKKDNKIFAEARSFKFDRLSISFRNRKNWKKNWEPNFILVVSQTLMLICFHFFMLRVLARSFLGQTQIKQFSHFSFCLIPNYRQIVATINEYKVIKQCSLIWTSYIYIIIMVMLELEQNIKKLIYFTSLTNPS